MQKYLIVAIGAALGGTGRYWVAHIVQSHLPPQFPYGTLTVNILGSFLLGIVVFASEMEFLVPPEARLFMAVGFCGAFTTFSTFSYETVRLLQDAEYVVASINIVLNVVLTLVGFVMAMVVLKQLAGG